MAKEEEFGRALREPALGPTAPEPASGLRPTGDDPARGRFCEQMRKDGYREVCPHCIATKDWSREPTPRESDGKSIAARIAKRERERPEMIGRFRNYWRMWRGRGRARMDHWLWLHWAIFGRYPR